MMSAASTVIPFLILFLEVGVVMVSPTFVFSFQSECVVLTDAIKLVPDVDTHWHRHLCAYAHTKRAWSRERVCTLCVDASFGITSAEEKCLIGYNVTIMLVKGREGGFEGERESTPFGAGCFLDECGSAVQQQTQTQRSM